MKLVHICEWNPLTGGAYTVVNNLINNTLKLDQSIEIHIVSFGEKTETVNTNDYTLHYIKYVDFPTARYWYLPNMLRNKILEINPDLIHLHFTYPPYSYLTNLPIPVIITTHGLSSVRIKGIRSNRNYMNLRFLIDPYLEKKALRKADRIITVSEWVKKETDALTLQTSKSIYIPNGINYETYQNIKKNGEVRHPSVFIVGRLVKFKGMDILIKSLPIIKKSVPNIHLYIAGEGSQYGKLKSLTAKLNVDENITFLGFISEDEKRTMLSSSDIFVISSRSETFGIVVLEALASGIPVVASKVGGIPQILNNGEYGILVKSEDTQGLANAIITLIRDPALRRELSEKGRKRAKEYSWYEITKKTIELYKLVI